MAWLWRFTIRPDALMFLRDWDVHSIKFWGEVTTAILAVVTHYKNVSRSHEVHLFQSFRIPVAIFCA